MTRSSDLDVIRCEDLGLSRITGEVIEFGPGPGTNFRCWSNASSIRRWVGVEPNEARGGRGKFTMNFGERTPPLGKRRPSSWATLVGSVSGGHLET